MVMCQRSMLPLNPPYFLIIGTGSSLIYRGESQIRSLVCSTFDRTSSPPELPIVLL